MHRLRADFRRILKNIYTSDVFITYVNSVNSVHCKGGFSSLLNGGFHKAGCPGATNAETFL